MKLLFSPDAILLMNLSWLENKTQESEKKENYSDEEMLFFK